MFARTLNVRGILAALSAMTLALAGCSNEYGPNALRSGMGRLSVSMVDAPATHVDEIIVTVSKVTAHSSEQGWVQIMEGNLTVDLLKLQQHAVELGFANLPAGKVTQIRLYLSEAGPQYVTVGTEQIDLKVPSGVQSGIKIKGPFNINSCTDTAVLIDFDGKKSIHIHEAQQGVIYILRPVIKVKKSSSEEVECIPPGEGDPNDPSFPGEGGTPGGDPSGGGDGSGDPTGDGSGDPSGGDGSGDPSGGDDGVNEGGSPGGGANAGEPCAAGADCLSGECVAGVCAPGIPGAACEAGADCASGTCQSDGTCAPGDAKPTGSPCASNAECLSGTCEVGICEGGGQGAPCLSSGDCAEGFACSEGFCQAVLQ